jgi:hypothetical protein
MTLVGGWQVWTLPPESLKRSGCGGAGTRRRVPAMPLSRRASGPWPPNRLRWVKPQYRMSRRGLKRAWTLGFIPYGQGRPRTWSRPGRSDRSNARQWFHPLSSATLRRGGDRRTKMGARRGVSREGGTRRKPPRPVVGSEPAWQPDPEASRKQSNVRLHVDRRTARGIWPVAARRSPVRASARVASRRSAVPHTAPTDCALSNSQAGAVRLFREAGC